jgi:hypothetical protein
LEQLKDLLRVYLFNTKVTHNGTQAFRKALPNCRVKWHPTKIHTQDAEETDFEGDYFNTERDEVSLLSNELSRAAPVMNEDMFWQLIDLLDWDKAGDDGAVLQPAVDALAELNVEDICAFSEILAQKLHQLDGEAYAREIGKDAFKGLKGDFSQNWFLFVRWRTVERFLSRLFSIQLRCPRISSFRLFWHCLRRPIGNLLGSVFITNRRYATRLSAIINHGYLTPAERQT